MQYKLQDEELKQRIISIRRDLHENPELSHKEFRTSQKISERLIELGIEVLDLGLATGVIGRLKGAKDGLSVALRGDIDALPIEELSDKPYRSKTEGIMHACGHDVHTAVVLGAAEILAEMQHEITGTIYFIFQPAEEVNEGARDIIEAGFFQKYPVDAIFGLHNNPAVPYGKIAIKEGGLMAAVDTLRVRVNGKGGHGALPNSTKDPVIATAAMLMNLQTIVSRNISPIEPSVISIGSIHAGVANNVIPDSVYFTGTVRSFSEEVRMLLHDRIHAVLESLAKSYEVSVDIEYIFHLPPVYNEKPLADIVRQAVEESLGREAIYDPIPSTGGEDFALFMKEVPGFFVWLGVGNEEKGITQIWHNPSFDIDEEALLPGAIAMASIATTFLSKGGTR